MSDEEKRAWPPGRLVEGRLPEDGLAAFREPRDDEERRTLARLGAGLLLQYACGLDGENPDLAETPARMARALEEMTAGRHEDPREVLAKSFDSDGYDEIVAVRDIEFTSLCEHHVLPFVGRASVAYLPGERVVGLSKIPRLVETFARRLQLQERMTRQIATALAAGTQARGVAVVVEARHECLACRGARKPTASMVTSCVLGVLRDDPGAKAEALALLGIGRPQR